MNAALRRKLGWFAPRAGIALGSLVLTLVVLEVGLRIFVPEGRIPFASENVPAGVYQPDDELGWRTTANLDVTYPTHDGEGTPYTVHQTYDADGFRNCRPDERGGERPVLLCVGDSFTAAGEVSDGETWHCRLGELLGADSWGYGAGGYGTLQELIVLRRHIDRIDPDVVVLQWTANDFVNNSFELELHSFVNNHAMRRPYRTADGGIEYRVPQTLGGLRRFARLHSRLAGGVLAIVDRLLASREGIEYEIIREGVDHPAMQRTLGISAGLLREVQEACGGRPLFVFVVDTHEPFLTAFERMCDDIGIPRIPEIAETVDAAGLKARAHDKGHWSPLGHDIAAQRIAEFLREREPEMFAAAE